MAHPCFSAKREALKSQMAWNLNETIYEMSSKEWLPGGRGMK
jgi:hypothetical protein